MTARARRGSAAPARRTRPGRRSAARPRCSKRFVALRRRILDPALPRRGRRDRGLGRAARTATRAASWSTSDVPAGPELAAADRRRRGAGAAGRRRARPCRHADHGVLRRATARPLFNEMAPRVHNSGHWTIEGALTSQFENHIRAICGLPLGATDLRRAARRDAQSGRRRGGGLARHPRRPERPPPPLRQERSPPRPQDGPRHPAARKSPSPVDETAR